MAVDAQDPDPDHDKAIESLKMLDFRIHKMHAVALARTQQHFDDRGMARKVEFYRQFTTHRLCEGTVMQSLKDEIESRQAVLPEWPQQRLDCLLAKVRETVRLLGNVFDQLDAWESSLEPIEKEFFFVTAPRAAHLYRRSQPASTSQEPTSGAHTLANGRKFKCHSLKDAEATP